MLRDSWWWPWWISSLIDLVLAFSALVVFHLSARPVLRAVAALLVVAGLVAAVLAPVVMTDQSGRHMRDEPTIGGGMPLAPLGPGYTAWRVRTRSESRR